MILEAGELDTRATLQQRVSKKNEIGEVEYVWKEIGKPWGKLTVASSKVLEIAKGNAVVVSHDFKARYTPTASNDCRLLVGEVEYSVSGVIHDPKKAWTQILLSKQEG